jgi:hypothetical protein
MMAVMPGEGPPAVLELAGVATTQPDGGVTLEFADGEGAAAQIDMQNPAQPSADDTLEYTGPAGEAATLSLEDATPTEAGLVLTFGDGQGSADQALIEFPPIQPLEKKYWFFYDASGNVTDVLDAADGSAAAHYEYEPYGRVLVAEGPYSAANPIRFSTKWWDAETGQGYWGYRRVPGTGQVWVAWGKLALPVRFTSPRPRP